MPNHDSESLTQQAPGALQPDIWQPFGTSASGHVKTAKFMRESANRVFTQVQISYRMS